MIEKDFFVRWANQVSIEHRVLKGLYEIVSENGRKGIPKLRSSKL